MNVFHYGKEFLILFQPFLTSHHPKGRANFTYGAWVSWNVTELWSPEGDQKSSFHLVEMLISFLHFLSELFFFLLKKSWEIIYSIFKKKKKTKNNMKIELHKLFTSFHLLGKKDSGNIFRTNVWKLNLKLHLFFIEPVCLLPLNGSHLYIISHCIDTWNVWGIGLNLEAWIQFKTYQKWRKSWNFSLG